MTSASGLAKFLGIDMRGPRKGLVHVPECHIQLSYDIVWRTPVRFRRLWQHRRSAVDHGFQSFVLDLDKGQRVLSLMPALGNDDRDRFTDVNDFVGMSSTT
jgi:hypothetical protein